jgi:formylglycine-generating enzyme required for sulfatase activity
MRSAQIWCNAFTEWYNEQNNTNLTTVYLDPYGNPLREVQDDYWPAKPDATGFRFPTPEEWDLAARWNGSDGTNTVTKTINGINFAEQPIKFTKGNSASGAKDWIGNAEETSKVAFCEYNSGGGGRASQFVKMLQPNALGLYDMSGNVAEMVLRYWEGSNESAVFQGRGGVSASGFLPGGSSFDDLAVGYINVYRHGLRLVRTAE